MKDYTIKAKIGSTDEKRVKEYLTGLDISFEERPGLFQINYISFEAKKSTWKQVKKDLGLVEVHIYSDFKELVK